MCKNVLVVAKCLIIWILGVVVQEPFFSYIFLILNEPIIYCKGKVCMRANCGPSGRSLSLFLQCEATGSISTCPWMGCQSIAGLPPPAFSSLVPMHRHNESTCNVSCPKDTTQCSWPGLEPGPLPPRSSALTLRPLRLTLYNLLKPL